MTLRWWRWSARWAILALAAWLCGLVWFTWHLSDPSPDSETHVDAIVVLTGGSMRLEHGFDLLIAGMGKKLFVSGVHTGVDSRELLRLTGEAQKWGRCCVVLGHDAVNTVGNAVETAHWLESEHYHSIRLVTADYHMRRSLLEFRRVLPPDIRIIPDPVFPEGSRFSVFGDDVNLRLILNEYDKFLLALARALVLPGYTFSHEHPLGY